MCCAGSVVVQYGRRNGLLGPTESHYGHEKLMPKFAWADLLADFPDALAVTVFGELYGACLDWCERPPSSSWMSSLLM